FNVLREVVMNDPPDVRLVDAHPKRDRRINDPRIVAEELFLVSRALAGFKSGVISPGGKSTTGQRFRHPFGRGPTRTVDNTALVLTLAHKLNDLLERLVLGHDAIGQVRPV